MPEKITVALPVNELKALLPFAYDADSRPAIRGIQVELRKSKRPLLIATDGRRLAVLRSQGEPHQDATTQFLLPLDLLKMTLRLLRAKMPFAPFTVDAKTVSIELHRGDLGDMNLRLTHPKAEQPYPKWREVVPMKTAQVGVLPRVSFNAQYMEDYGHVAKVLRGDWHPLILFLGEDPDLNAAVIRIDQIPDFYGVLMPCRVRAFEGSEPNDWMEMGEEKPKTKADAKA